MILVAEDNEINQLVVEQTLLGQKYEYKIVENGRLAVEGFKSLSPDLIIMDVSMPEMNGYDATKAIRELEEKMGGHVPIIGVTAHALKGDRENCIEAGMDDYMAKPINPTKLEVLIAKWIGSDGDRIPYFCLRPFSGRASSYIDNRTSPFYS